MVRKTALKSRAITGFKKGAVAPRAGAWIETACIKINVAKIKSLPVRERGLKLLIFLPGRSNICRSPCGSVD